MKIIARIKKGRTKKIKLKNQPSDFLVQFQNVSKRYNSITALEKINFGLRRGEFVCLVGPSGAGKSTIIKLLTREELPSSGKIIVAGRDISSFNERILSLYRRKIGIVFQDYKLLPHKTVFENIAFALEVCDATNEEISDRVPKVLNLVGLADRAESYPVELSGGEKQRAAIGRALIHSPKILIADEPTGNLDMNNSREVIELLLRINRSGTLVLLATHDLQIVNTLRRRVIKIEHGRLTEDRKAVKSI